MTVSGSSVSAWNDKSGTGNNVTQSTAADMPQRVTAASGFNGRSALSFNGTSQLLQTAGNFVSYVQPQNTIFVLSKQGAVTNTFVFSMTGSDTRNQRIAMTDPWGTSTNNVIDWDAGNDSNDSITATNQWGSGVHLAELGLNESAGTAYISFDGTPAGTLTTGVTTPTAFTSVLSVGWGAYTNAYFNGSLGEMLVYSRVLSTPEAQDVEGYEAWKWGTQSLLPSTHPFSQHPYSCKGPAVNGQLTCT
jgi:hypothetical protein